MAHCQEYWQKYPTCIYTNSVRSRTFSCSPQANLGLQVELQLVIELCTLKLGRHFLIFCDLLQDLKKQKTKAQPLEGQIPEFYFRSFVFLSFFLETASGKKDKQTNKKKNLHQCYLCMSVCGQCSEAFKNPSNGVLLPTPSPRVLEVIRGCVGREISMCEHNVWTQHSLPALSLIII